MCARVERRRSLLQIARQAIAACDGGPLCREAAAQLEPRAGPFHLLGAGNASAAMARGLLAGRDVSVAGGLLVTKDGHGHGWSGAGLELRFAGHPEPDLRSVAAGGAAQKLVTGLTRTALMGRSHRAARPLHPSSYARRN